MGTLKYVTEILNVRQSERFFSVKFFIDTFRHRCTSLSTRNIMYAKNKLHVIIGNSLYNVYLTIYLLMPGFEGTLLSECCFGQHSSRAIARELCTSQSNSLRA